MITKNMKSGYGANDPQRIKAEQLFNYPENPIVSNGGDDMNPDYRRFYKKGGHVMKKSSDCKKNKQ